MDGMMTPAAFSEKYGISRAVITRCKQMGAPVRFYGTAGRKYWIPEADFLEWMDARGREEAREKSRRMSIIEMREARHRAVGIKKAR